eukprot:767256-Hanusia_phi.AAC.5
MNTSCGCRREEERRETYITFLPPPLLPQSLLLRPFPSSIRSLSSSCVNPPPLPPSHPKKAANISGVSPLKFFASTSAPAFTRKATILSCPFPAQQCSGVLSNTSWSFTPAPCERRKEPVSSPSLRCHIHLPLTNLHRPAEGSGVKSCPALRVSLRDVGSESKEGFKDEEVFLEACKVDRRAEIVLVVHEIDFSSSPMQPLHFIDIPILHRLHVS